MNPQKDDGGKWNGNRWAGTYEEWEKYCAEQDANLPTRLTDEEAEADRDMVWASQDPEIQELYEGKIIAIHKRRVIAVGDDWKTVLEEALRITGLPRRLFAVVSIPDTASFFGCH
ncbi:MAG TPA: DUF5678 domain-containing protein [Gemmataceae bacterium]|nr:DUF5678 domain-containing protein [Gemmataceae bacterium]